MTAAVPTAEAIEPPFGGPVVAPRGAPITGQPEEEHRAPTLAPSARVLRGALVLIGTQPITWAATLLTTVFVPHFLGADGFGQYAIAAALAGLFGMLASLGAPDYLRRRIATHPGEATQAVRAGLLLVTGTCIAVAALLGLLAPLAGAIVSDPAVLRIALAGMVVTGVQSVFFAALVGRERHDQYAWLNAAGVALSALLGIGALRLGGGVVHYSAGVVVGFAAVLAISMRLALGGLRGGVRPGLWGQVARGGRPFLAWNVAIQIRNQSDVAIVGALLGDAAAGWLAGANRIVTVPGFIPTLIATPLLPALSRCAQTGDRSGLRKALSDSITGVLVLCLPAAGLTAALAPAVPGLLHWGPSFAPAVPLMQILAIAFSLTALDVVLGTALFALHMERQWVRVATAAAVFSPVTNFLLIPISQRLYANGAIGAALVTTATELIMLAGALWLIPKDLVDRSMFSRAVRVLGAALILFAVASALQGTSVLLAAVAGGGSYVVALLALGVVRPADVPRLVAATGVLTRKSRGA